MKVIKIIFEDNTLRSSLPSYNLKFKISISCSRKNFLPHLLFQGVHDLGVQFGPLRLRLATRGSCQSGGGSCPRAIN